VAQAFARATRGGPSKVSETSSQLPARTGTLRAQVRTPSLQTYRSSVPLALGLRPHIPECEGGFPARRAMPSGPVSFDLRATITSKFRCGRGHCVLESVLLRSDVSQQYPPGAWPETTHSRVRRRLPSPPRDAIRPRMHKIASCPFLGALARSLFLRSASQREPRPGLACAP